MNKNRMHVVSLEADEASARSGFACLFSTSDEYESAVITERRAQGRYGRPRGPWPLVMVIGVALMAVGSAMIWH
ncbi:hypothetical protein [Bradyrhizobium sp.]|jgi:hypothetical protein|uniref:hypothetical protein n=1 Tax=Bradyrhizobium sp. TaxID=376 RepID=UPI002BC080BA|nr:hypothetical protein [Bradyrhizobium sp.]HWX61375.1 hypothetical protein [Bradyrhizobium sp.]